MLMIILLSYTIYCTWWKCWVYDFILFRNKTNNNLFKYPYYFQNIRIIYSIFSWTNIFKIKKKIYNTVLCFMMMNNIKLSENKSPRNTSNYIFKCVNKNNSLCLLDTINIFYYNEKVLWRVPNAHRSILPEVHKSIQ